MIRCNLCSRKNSCSEMPLKRRRNVRKFFSKPRKGYRVYGSRKCLQGQRKPDELSTDVANTISRGSHNRSLHLATETDSRPSGSAFQNSQDGPRDDPHTSMTITQSQSIVSVQLDSREVEGFRGFPLQDIPKCTLHWCNVSPNDELLARDVLRDLEVPTERVKPLRALSLFDGIGTAFFVLKKKLGIKIERYYSCEIDNHAISVLKHNFPEQIVHLGSVLDLHQSKLDALGHIDLLLGGSPCTELSLVNPRRKGLYDRHGSGILFFEYVRVLRYLQSKTGNNLLWLFENTRAMEQDTLQDIISSLGCAPAIHCSSAFVPMKRPRYFWGNIPGMYNNNEHRLQKVLTLQDFLKPHRQAVVKHIPTVTTSKASQRSGKSRNLPVLENGQECALSSNEIEILFGLPEHFTNCSGLSETTKRSLLGRGWSVHVIESILKPLGDMFQKDVIEN